MSTSSAEIDRSGCVHTVERAGEHFVLHAGEHLLWEPLPVGTRVLYPPPPLPPLDDADGAIDRALDQPLGADPLSAQLRPGMRLTIAFDDLSVPLPPMHAPDVRGRVIERVLDRCAAAGVDDIHLIAAVAMHRKMTPAELREVVGPRVFDVFFPRGRLVNHDVEDPEGSTLVGTTAEGWPVRINRRAAESDLLVYVNLTFAPMNGGHKSVTTGLATYDTIRHHHNVHSLMHSPYMNPAESELHAISARMGRVVAGAVRQFQVETMLNNASFPAGFRFLQKPEGRWSAAERAGFAVLRRGLRLTPYEVRRRAWMATRAPFGVTGVNAGDVDLVHARTLEAVARQHLVPAGPPCDVVVLGLPYLTCYNVNSVLNPLLAWVSSVGYAFNAYRGRPLVRRGGVLIVTHPLEPRWSTEHHPSYVEFYERVLAATHDPAVMERDFEPGFAADERYRRLYREGHAYHGVHPFYVWYWGIRGAAWCGRVIAAGGDPAVAARLGFASAPTLREALAQAEEVVGPRPSVACYHWPPLFQCDVS